MAGTIFGLGYATPSEWVAEVQRDPLALLSDHAHCELRAAASAQAMIVRNPGRTDFVCQMLALAREELEHFEQVTALLAARGGRLDHKQPNPYADGLLAGSVAGRTDPFLDRLLVAGLIETEQAHLHYGDQAGIESVGRTIGMRRMGRPDDIGDVCVFLSSPLARWMSGGPVYVDGGGEGPAFQRAAINVRKDPREA